MAKLDYFSALQALEKMRQQSDGDKRGDKLLLFAALYDLVERNPLRFSDCLRRAEKQMSKKIATLTPEEDAAWDKLFSLAALNSDASSSEQIAELAWADLQKEFPRLREYDGCQ